MLSWMSQLQIIAAGQNRGTTSLKTVFGFIHRGGQLPAQDEPVALQASLQVAPKSRCFPLMQGPRLVFTRSFFSSRYPSELLDRGNVPNQRVMAWLHRNIQEKHWRPCAWRFRLSIRQQEDPDIGPQLGMYALSSILNLRTMGVALLKGAHLLTLKEYDRAFLVRASHESGLRSPSTSELEYADQQLWSETGMLFQSGWSLHDSIHEIVTVRSSMAGNHVLLLYRLFLLCARLAPSHARVRPAARARQIGPARAVLLEKVREMQAKLRASRINRAASFSGKTICMRYNTRRGCEDKNCRFLHACCAQDPATQKVCGGVASY